MGHSYASEKVLFQNQKALGSNAEITGLYWSMKVRLTCQQADFVCVLLWQTLGPDLPSLMSCSCIPPFKLHICNSAKALCGRKIQGINKVTGIPVNSHTKTFLGIAPSICLNSPGCHRGWCLSLELSWIVPQALTLTKVLCLCQHICICSGSICNAILIYSEWQNYALKPLNSKQNTLMGVQFHLVSDRVFLNTTAACLEKRAS